MDSDLPRPTACPANEHVLLTGATGLLGRALLHLLIRRPGRRITAMVRRTEQISQFHSIGVETVMGDLSRPRLGIEPWLYDGLADSLTGIIHAAADIRFDLSLAESRAINVFGTQQILDLGRACRNLKKFVHLSSVFIKGYRQGEFPEEPVPPGQRFVNTYQQSKYEAEGLALGAMSDLPLAIYRLSLLMADSLNGEVSQYNYFHHLLRHLPGCPLPMIPGDPRVTLDLIPNDWAAGALAHLWECRFEPGSIRQVCAGPARAIPLTQATEILSRVTEARCGRPMPVPKLVSIGEYNRFLANCSGAQRAYADWIGPHVRILAIRQTHLNSQTLADLAGTGLELPSLAGCFERTVAFGLDHDWGRATGQQAAHR